MRELETAQDLQNHLLAEVQRESKRLQDTADKVRLLQKPLGLLTKQEEEMYAHEMLSISEVERLE